MSCMMLEKEHYQFIANSLYRIGVQFDRHMPFSATRSHFGDHLARNKEKKILEFVRLLQDWNLEAYNERYPQYADDGYVPEYVSFIAPLGGDLASCQFLKACECVRYQCSDAGEWHYSPEYVVLVNMIEEAKDYIIDELSSYKAAKWALSEIPKGSRVEVIA